MFRKTLVSLVIAVVLLVTMAAAVSAQSESTDAEDGQPSIEPTGGAIVQSIPLTLTVNVQGPDGMITVDVPVVISLDIQVSMSNVLTAEVSVESEVEAVAPVEDTPVEEKATEETASKEAASEEAVEEPAVEEPTEAAADEPAEEETADDADADDADADDAADADADDAAEESATEEAASEEAASEEVVEEPAEKVAPTPVPVGRRSADTEKAAEGEEAAAEGDKTAEGEEAATDEEEPAAEAVDTNCTDSRSVIYTPEAGDAISGTMEVYGNATHEMFRYYKLEYANVDNEGDEYAFIVDSKNAVSDGLLAVLDTNTLINGNYVLRLTVVDATGNFPPQCSVPVTIAN